MRFGFRFIASLLLLTAVAFAADNKVPPSSRQLPALLVRDANGSQVSIKDQMPKGNWLLIYVDAKSDASDSMLSELKSAQYSSYLDQMIIIVGSVKADALAKWSSKYPDLANAHWFADPDQSVFRTLNLHGIPVEMGMRETAIRWNLLGMPPNLANFHSILLDWMKVNAN